MEAELTQLAFCFTVGILRSFKNLVPYFACKVELARGFFLLESGTHFCLHLTLNLSLTTLKSACKVTSSGIL